MAGSQCSHQEHFARDQFISLLMSTMRIAPVAHTRLMLKTACQGCVHCVVLFISYLYNLASYHTWKLKEILFRLIHFGSLTK